MHARKLFLSALLTALLLPLSHPARAITPVDLVDPLTGAKCEGGNLGGGKTFPGACLPFGMVQLSPDTITGGDNGPGYSYPAKTIEGFSFAHMSGVGAYGDLGNLQVMPMTGPLQFHSGSNANDLDKSPDPSGKSDPGWKSPFSHTTESASPGYYAVTLDRYHIRAEMTATTHAGILRFTFPDDPGPRIQIDLARRIGGRAHTEYAKLLDNHTLEGWMKYEGDGRGFSAKTRYTFYFHAEFDQPLQSHGFWNKSDDLGPLPEKESDDLGFYATFKPNTKTLHMKAGISFVSIENARENLNTELRDFDFNRTRLEASAAWFNPLSKIDIEGGTDTQQKIFYTALYHTCIDPRIFSDVNGDFFGADKKIHRADNYTQRTIFSGWDVFRSQFPLQTLINPDIVNDEINSLMHVAETTNGIFPRWELLNTEAGTMVGNPAIVVLNDAWSKGIRGYNPEKAYTIARNTNLKNANDPALGYTPNQISRTLEYCFDDWSLSQLAAAMNKPDDAKLFAQRSLSYKKIWNDEVHWFRGRKSDGSWIDWKGREQQGQGCVESNPYQQGWFVPHDVPGLITLIGGEEKFTNELEQFFEATPHDFSWNNFYNHSNEPVHHVPFLFVYSGAPWLTQKWTRTICENAYGLGPDGLCGNEDVGQMSAWYILAAAGFHPVAPGDGIYILTSPLFNKITFHLVPHYATGKTFTILAHDNSPTNLYIQSATLNGQPLNRAWIRHNEITAGGTLELQMAPTPHKSWATAKDQRPPSTISAQ